MSDINNNGFGRIFTEHSNEHNLKWNNEFLGNDSTKKNDEPMFNLNFNFSRSTNERKTNEIKKVQTPINKQTPENNQPLFRFGNWFKRNEEKMESTTIAQEVPIENEVESAVSERIELIDVHHHVYSKEMLEQNKNLSNNTFESWFKKTDAPIEPVNNSSVQPEISTVPFLGNLNKRNNPFMNDRNFFTSHQKTVEIPEMEQGVPIEDWNPFQDPSMIEPMHSNDIPVYEPMANIMSNFASLQELKVEEPVKDEISINTPSSNERCMTNIRLLLAQIVNHSTQNRKLMLYTPYEIIGCTTVQFISEDVIQIDQQFFMDLKNIMAIQILFQNTNYIQLNPWNDQLVDDFSDLEHQLVNHKHVPNMEIAIVSKENIRLIGEIEEVYDGIVYMKMNYVDTYINVSGIDSVHYTFKKNKNS